MTISYSDNYFKILAHWRGSAWKAVWRELLLWLLFYYAIKLILEFAVPLSNQSDAKRIVALFGSYTDKVPLQFLLGFYVGQVLTRWWAQIQNVPWPDDIMAWVCALIPESDREARLRRHTVARYLVLSETLVLRTVSSRIRKRFPTMQTLIESELMTKDELELFNKCPCPNTGWQLPIQWAINGILVPLTMRATNPVTMGTMGHMMNCFNAFRGNLRQLFMYDWICIPLVYTQTVSVVVYGYFAMCLIGHQALGTGTDIFVPVLTILQFIFYVGWFKVAQDLMRPFGEDDDDVELNYLLDRHAAVAMNMANYVTTNNPPLVEDPHFQSLDKTTGADSCFTLAYTKLSLLKNRDRPPKLHAAVGIKQPKVQLEMTFKETETGEGGLGGGGGQMVVEDAATSTTMMNGAISTISVTVPNGGVPGARLGRPADQRRPPVTKIIIRNLRKLTKSNREHVFF